MQVVSKEPRGRIVKESKDHQAKSPVLGSFCIVVRKTTNRRVPKKKNWVRLLPLRSDSLLWGLLGSFDYDYGLLSKDRMVFFRDCLGLGYADARAGFEPSTVRG